MSTQSSKVSQRDVEYKEYIFETNINKSVESKVASFWKHVKENDFVPPENSIFKSSYLEECVKSEETAIINEEEHPTTPKIIEKWGHTLCLFKKQGLYKAALNIVPKKCQFCDEKSQFLPKYADEVDEIKFIRDYGK